MANYLGGSAWAMAKDIAEGFVLVTERTFVRFEQGELEKLAFELDRFLRDVRGEQPDVEDVAAVQNRNRRLSRLTGALTMLRSYQQRRFRRSIRPEFDGKS